MNLLGGEVPPAAKRFRLEESNQIEQQHFEHNGDSVSNTEDNNNLSASSVYDENHVEFCLKLEKEGGDDSTEYVNFDENNEQSLGKKINNFDKSLSPSSKTTQNLTLPPMTFDFLKFINSTNSPLNNALGKETKKADLPKLNLSNASQFLAQSNNMTPSLFDGLNLLTPKDLTLKASRRRSNGSSSSLSASPPHTQSSSSLERASKYGSNQVMTPPSSTPLLDLSFAMSLFQQANSLFINNNNNNNNKSHNTKSARPLNNDIKATTENLLTRGITSPCSQRSQNTTPGATNGASPAPVPIPGAVAVAASPAAILFSQDDWSWHRNPAASIRSGGTNKQTPVWKYFVYNKVENLSRCIVGSCTYTLKGPHTSTLACHLKKHPAQYAEFQKLKLRFQAVYTRERNTGQLVNNGMNADLNKNFNSLSTNSSLASASPSSNASSSGINGLCLGLNRDTASPNISASNLFKKLNANSKSEGQGNVQTPQNNSNLNNIGALNLAYAAAAAAAAAAANSNSTRYNSASASDAKNLPNNIKNSSFPYSGIFTNGNLNVNNLPPGIAAAMTAAAAASKNNNILHNNISDKKDNCGTATGKNQSNNNNLGSIKKALPNPGKAGTSMSEILAALNKRAEAAAAAATLNNDNVLNASVGSNFAELKYSLSPSPSNDLQSVRNEALLQSKFPTLEALFRNEEENGESENQLLNSKMLMQNSIDKSPSKLFHSALDLAVSSVNMEESKNDIMFNSFNYLNDTSSSRQFALNSGLEKKQPLIAKSMERRCQKWQSNDTNQRDLETKLAIWLSCLELPLTLIQNSMFKELLETAQPKFTMPSQTNSLKKIIDEQYFKIFCSIQSQLSSVAPLKIALTVRIINKTETANGEVDLMICVFATFYQITKHKTKTILLGIRSIKSCETDYSVIQELVDEILEKYSLSKEKVGKTLFINNIQKFSNQCQSETIKPIGVLLARAFQKTFNSCSATIELQQALCKMASTFFTNSFAMEQLSKLTGYDEYNLQSLLSPSNSFYALSCEILKIKDSFLMVCRQAEVVDTIKVIDEIKWIMLEEIVSIILMFQNFLYGVLDDRQHCLDNKLISIKNQPTIDAVVPALMRIQNDLKNDFNYINEFAEQLNKTIDIECSKFVNVDLPDFDGIFVQATALNPTFAKRYLNEKQLEYAKAVIKNTINKTELIKSNSFADLKVVSSNINNNFNNNNDKDNKLETCLLSQLDANDENGNLSLSDEDCDNNDNNEKIKIKSNTSCANPSTLCSNLIEVANQRIQELETNQQIRLDAESAVQCYFNEISNTNMQSLLSENEFITNNSKLFNFWEKYSEKNEALSQLALELLSVPITSIPIDQILNNVYDFQHKTPNKTTSSNVLINFEQNALLRFNRLFLYDSF